MQKKGLSPLIATVLLIGITVSLAALVMVWGQALFKQTTEETGETTTAEITCTSRVQVDVLNATCAITGPGNLSAILDNKNEQPIEGFIARVYGVGNSVQTVILSPTYPLESFNTQEYFIAYDSLKLRGEVTKLEIIPQIRTDSGRLHACGQRIDTFVLQPVSITQCI